MLKKYCFAVLALLMIAAFHSIGVHAQEGMVAVPSFDDPPKKQTPAQPAQQPTPSAPPAAQPSQSPVRATPTPPPPSSAPRNTGIQQNRPVPELPRPVLVTPPPPAPTAQPLPPPTAQPLPPPTAQPLPPPPTARPLPPPTAQPLPPPPTAQPLPPPTAQPLPPPPTAQPLPTVNVKNDPSTCSEDNVLSVIRKAFAPNPRFDRRGRQIPNQAENIRKDGKTAQSGIEVCKQQGLQAFSDAIKTSYERVGDETRGYMREVNPGPLREQFRSLIRQERAEIFQAEEEKRKQDELLAKEEKRKQDELRAAEEKRKQDELRAAEERRKRESIGKQVAPQNPKVQAVYFIDGTKSAYKQRNLFHQMSRVINPINTSSPTAKGYLRILSGISTNNAEGTDDLYSLAAQSMLEDVTNKGVNEIYLLGFSRGAIVALNLTKDICGEGSTNIKINYRVISHWWGRSVNGTDKPASEFLMICEKIKAVVLIDPVNTFMPNWSTVASEKLKPNTVNIFKRNQNEHFLTNAQISNITHAEAVSDLDHGGMMCGKVDTAANSNLVFVRHHAVQFLQQRGLRINEFDLQNCITVDGAWPPGIYRQEDSTLTFTRGESPTNWELNTW